MAVPVRPEPRRIASLFSRGFAPDVRGRKEARALAEAGHDVTVLAWDRECRWPEHEQMDGFTVERLRRRALLGKGLAQLGRWLWFWRRLTSILVERRFDAIHANDLDTLPAAWWAARRTGARLVFDAHEPNYYAYWPAYQYPALALARQLERSLARRADHVIVTNSYQMEKYRRMGMRRVSLVANYPLLSLVEGARPPSYTDLSEVVLGRIGAVYEDTGVEEIVQAAQLLVARGRKVRLLIAGRLVDSYRARFESLLEPVRSYTDIVGTYTPEQIADLYGRCHLSLQPYLLSRWFRHITPVKFFESIAHGVPVVATDIGGIGDVMRNHDCGYVLSSPAPEEVARAVESLLDQPERLAQMSRNGMDAVREAYNWERMVTNLVEAYRTLWASAPRVGVTP